jgi:hypothetical protein
MDPIAQRLAVHAADPRGLRPVHPVKHRRQRQKPPALVPDPRRRGKPPKLTGREIPPNAHRCWHGANPPRAMQSAQPKIRNPRESQTMAPGLDQRGLPIGFAGKFLITVEESFGWSVAVDVETLTGTSHDESSSQQRRHVAVEAPAPGSASIVLEVPPDIPAITTGSFGPGAATLRE